MVYSFKFLLGCYHICSIRVAGTYKFIFQTFKCDLLSGPKYVATDLKGTSACNNQKL